jgi:hypothetical protein
MGLVEALEQLSKAREYVVEGEKCLSRQRRVVARLEQKGCDPMVAIILLEILEEMQDEYVDHLERIGKQVLTMVKPEEDQHIFLGTIDANADY